MGELLPLMRAPIAGTAVTTPAFSQPAPTGPTANYATLVDRGFAVIIDHIILFVISLIIILPLGLLGAVFGGAGFFFFGPVILLGWVVWILYFTFFEGTTGQTPGKQLLNIKTVDELTQKPVDMARSFIRNLLRIIDWCPFSTS